MEKPLLTTIIPLRNRSGIRLENALKSLRWQKKIESESLEILLVDFGSDAEHAKSIKEMASKYDASVVRYSTNELWNRSKALNIGILNAKAPQIFCTDADMVFEDNFVSTILKYKTDNECLNLILCRCRDLPDMGSERVYEKEEFQDLKNRSTMRVAMGTGACQVFDKKWAKSVHGYDEKYIFWGFEDKDMVARARKSGLKPIWIHEETAMLHQWHRRSANDKLYLKYKNKLRFYLTQGIIVKNRTSWGGSKEG